jgi:hypothetical protein
MSVPKKATRRINVTFPVDLLDLLDSVVPSRERNHFIVQATERSLHSERLRVVLAELRSKPGWSDEDHPDLKTAEDVDRYIRRMRESWMPYTWDDVAGEATQGADAQGGEAEQGG